MHLGKQEFLLRAQWHQYAARRPAPQANWPASSRRANHSEPHGFAVPLSAALTRASNDTEKASNDSRKRSTTGARRAKTEPKSRFFPAL